MVVVTDINERTPAHRGTATKIYMQTHSQTHTRTLTESINISVACEAVPDINNRNFYISQAVCQTRWSLSVQNLVFIPTLWTHFKGSASHSRAHVQIASGSCVYLSYISDHSQLHPHPLKCVYGVVLRTARAGLGLHARTGVACRTG